MKLFLFLIINIMIVSGADKKEIIDWQVLKFRYIIEQSVKNSADSFDIENSCDAAFNSFLQSINKDSKYFDKKVMTKIISNDENKSVGLGIRYLIVNDTVTVLEDYSGQLNSGAKILKIDNLELTGKSYDEINFIINGTPETDVIVEATDDKSVKKIIYTRKEYVKESVETYFDINNSGYCYLRIDRFSAGTAKEIDLALQKLSLERKIKYIIIDLRNNPGGLIEETANCLSLFLPDSMPVSEIKSRNKDYNKKYYTSGNDGQYENIPLAVLIDSTSKSGSELFAAVIQEYDRGVVIGSKSFGKGSVQNGFPMKDSTAFRLTVAYYYTPLGRKIEISKNPTKLAQANQLSLDKDIYNTLQKTINKFGTEEIKFVKTKQGRVYFQTGGISPDYFVFNDTLTLLTNVLIKRGLFYRYAFDYVARNQNKLKKYNNFKHYSSNFKLTEDEMKEFVQMCLNQNIWNNSMFENDKQVVYNNIKAAIAYVFWHKTAFEYQLINYDKLVIEAVRRFNDSSNLLNN